LNSEEAALRLGNIRKIAGYDDLRICHLLGKLESGQRLGLRLLKELRRLDVETVIIIQILRMRKLADRTDLYETVNKVEDNSCEIGDVFDSLATYVVFQVARGCCHKKFRRRGGVLRSGGKICCSCISRCSQRKVRWKIPGRV
jgi:hypothetical protein